MKGYRFEGADESEAGERPREEWCAGAKYESYKSYDNLHVKSLLTCFELF